jgi:Na+/H+-translocating membrane pyrophosphatase
MILPGVLVIASPLVMGLFFGKTAVGGLLAGIIVSGIQVAISASNTGGAWDNAKKFIEGGNMSTKPLKEGEQPFKFGKHTDEHVAAIIGDTVGDPLKDTSGPAINILIKLSAIVSLVFGSFFTSKYANIFKVGV